MSKPLAEQIIVIFPQRGSRTENVRYCSTAVSIADKRQGQWVPTQKPRRKSNNSVIGEGFDHTYISSTDSCFQIAAHLLSKKANKPTHNKKIPKWKKRGEEGSFSSSKTEEKGALSSTNIKLQQIDQRMASVIKNLITAIWKKKKVLSHGFHVEEAILAKENTFRFNKSLFSKPCAFMWFEHEILNWNWCFYIGLMQPPKI